MPYKVDTLKIKLWKHLDRRIKLTDQQRDEIRENVEWLSMTKLGIKYWVTRHTISNVMYPERYEHRKLEYRERRSDGRYYNKDKHRIAIKKTRKYRHRVLSKTIENDSK